MRSQQELTTRQKQRSDKTEDHEKTSSLPGRRAKPKGPDKFKLG
jgi:hypothetical protein